MEIAPIDGSSSIAQAGYDPSTNTMHVIFKSGAGYAYDKVPVEIWSAFQEADSKGGFLHRHVRGRYEQRRL